MRRSKFALSLGILLTIASFLLWGLSCRGSGSAFVLPSGTPATAGDFRSAIGVRIDEGSLLLFYTQTDFTTSSILGFLGWQFTPYADLHSWDTEAFPLPSLQQLAFGDFAFKVDNYPNNSHLTLSFWFITFAFIFVTLATFWMIRRTEDNMITQQSKTKKA